jgi:hypothetical protein
MFNARYEVMRNYEAKDFYGWHPEDTLHGICHNLVHLDIFHGFLEVSDVVVAFLAHHRDIVEVGMDISTNLVI